MAVMDILSRKLTAGVMLKTPIKEKTFKVESVSPTGVTLILGQGWRTPISADCWNGIPDYLKGRDWVEIGSVHGTSKPGTLENYVDGFIPRSAGTYVASILEHVGLVEIDRKVPSKVRLISYKP